MFFDKLWLRIRGELLALKEDFSAGTDIGDKAEALLNKLEKRINGFQSQTHQHESERLPHGTQSKNQSLEASELKSLREIEQEWEDLMRRRNEHKGTSHESESVRPNPRRLG